MCIFSLRSYAYNGSLEKCETVESLKDVLYNLVSTYFYETSLLFRMASVSVPIAISIKKIVKELPDKEYQNRKAEATIQYDKV
jgi:hypothetical protein